MCSRKGKEKVCLLLPAGVGIGGDVWTQEAGDLFVNVCSNAYTALSFSLFIYLSRARALSLFLSLSRSLLLSLSLARALSVYLSFFRLGETFSHMGILYYQMKDYENALVFYQLALDIRLNKLGV
jgi:hypothetical protein